jgi:hypothetical protein
MLECSAPRGAPRHHLGATNELDQSNRCRADCLGGVTARECPAANIGVYPETYNNKEKGCTLITINGVIQPGDGEKFVQALARGNEAKVDEINDRCDTLVHLCNVCLGRGQPQLDDLRAFIGQMFADDVAGVTKIRSARAELEGVWPSRRFSDPRTKRLAQLLGLTSEFWTCNFVNDIAGPCHPPDGGYQANKDWAACREVRKQLLEATGLTKKSPAKRRRRAKADKDEDAQLYHEAASDASCRTN